MHTQRSWTAHWIEPAQETVSREASYSLREMFIEGKRPPEPGAPETRLWPVHILKRAFDIEKPVVKATLYMSARGLYGSTLNGSAVTDAIFTPDYTSYEHIIMYQVYDITDLLHVGANVWGATLADGWFAGRISTQGNSAQYGDRLSLLGEIELVYADGTSELVGTDSSWRSTTERYVYSDIQIGEKQDLRLADDAWATTEDTEGWDQVTVVAPPEALLIEQEGPLVKRMCLLDACSCWQEGDATVVDFGQVVTGRVRVDLELAEGQEIKLEHAEVLDAKGRFFHNIIGRNKDAVDVFVGRGRRETLEPEFTFHGFRYVRVTGLAAPLDLSAIRAVVICSDLPKTGSLVTSDARVNRLLANIEWSQRGNMLSIPTDCPQRERMGWTGDIQVYAPTGCFFMDLKGFLTRWLDQVMADQLPDGQVIDYSPATKDEFDSGEFLGAISSAGWGDAIVLVPWALYREYGDLEPLKRCYDAMIRWNTFCMQSAAEGKADTQDESPFIWDTKFHYGDWMLPSFLMGPDARGPIEAAHVTGPLVATCFLAHTSEVLSHISDLLGHTERAAQERAYAQCVRSAFARRFSDGHGKLSVEYQGCYVLALAFDMLPEDERQAAANRLAQMIAVNGNRLDTGFLSIPYLLDVLGAWGYEELAEKVFWQKDCPGWFYEVDRGATTIWENWAGIAPDGAVGAHSFNHYAFGCVGDWMVRKIGGLTIRQPGYKEFDIAPVFPAGIDFAKLEHETPYGRIEVAWHRLEDGLAKVEVSVPAGCTAYAKLPDQDERELASGAYELYCKVEPTE